MRAFWISFLEKSNVDISKSFPSTGLEICFIEQPEMTQREIDLVFIVLFESKELSKTPCHSSP